MMGTLRRRPDVAYDRPDAKHLFLADETHCSEQPASAATDQAHRLAPRL
jgi:hypothetical protein